MSTCAVAVPQYLNCEKIQNKLKSSKSPQRWLYCSRPCSPFMRILLCASVALVVGTLRIRLYHYTAFLYQHSCGLSPSSVCLSAIDMRRFPRPPPPTASPYVQTVSHLNWFSALPSYEGRAIRWRGSNSISVSDHHNIKEGAVYCA
jgi:hypothetical protein